MWRAVCGVQCVVCGCVAVWLCVAACGAGALVAAIDVRSGDEAGHVILRGGGGGGVITSHLQSRAKVGS